MKCHSCLVKVFLQLMGSGCPLSMIHQSTQKRLRISMTVKRPKNLWCSLCQNVLPSVRVRINCVILLFFASPLCQVSSGWWTLFWGEVASNWRSLTRRLLSTVGCFLPWPKTSLQTFLFSSPSLFVVLTEMKLSKNSVSRTIRPSDSFSPVSSSHLFFCSNHNSTRLLLTQSPVAVKV